MEADDRFSRWLFCLTVFDRSFSIFHGLPHNSYLILRMAQAVCRRTKKLTFSAELWQNRENS